MSPRLQTIIRNPYFKPVLFLALAMVFAWINTPYFITVRNFRALLISTAPLMIVAVGGGMVVLTGMIDLSLESVLAASGVLIATMDIIWRFPTTLSIVLTLLFGALIGLTNGILVVKARIPSFVVTLGMYWGLRGLAMVISDGRPISPSSVSPPQPFSFLWFSGEVFGIPVMIVFAFGIALFLQYYISEFKRGREIYAVGGNEMAARNCGINVGVVKVFVFVVSGVLAATAGIIMTAWITQAYAWTAQGLSLQAIAAIVLGGIPFIGGFGTILGVLIGAFIIGMISNLIVLIGISPLFSYVVTAIVLVLAGLQVQKGAFVK